ncbi:TetR/AcrR family transcriptional regulator [Tsukamurella strandjordii]|uniref:TetR/AcrR family transcriptional regulator n=1 Tax=Tsukamurella strandjordii TaxID=147577 RepID=UPI0031D4DE1F
MSSAPSDLPRRRLTPTQADTVAKLCAAVPAVLAEHGVDGFTVRLAARAAGVSPATAYTYFSSKNHLIAEVFARRVEAELVEPDPSASPRDRLLEVLCGLVDLVLIDPQFATAVNTALLGHEPDAQVVRLRVGLLIRGRLAEALGPGAPSGLVESVELAYSGVLVQAGMGYIDVAASKAALTRAVDLMMRD